MRLFNGAQIVVLCGDKKYSCWTEPEQLPTYPWDYLYTWEHNMGMRALDKKKIRNKTKAEYLYEENKVKMHMLHHLHMANAAGIL